VEVIRNLPTNMAEHERDTKAKRKRVHVVEAAETEVSLEHPVFDLEKQSEKDVELWLFSYPKDV
jgi:hypothetical protein